MVLLYSYFPYSSLAFRKTGRKTTNYNLLSKSTVTQHEYHSIQVKGKYISALNISESSLCLTVISIFIYHLWKGTCASNPSGTCLYVTSRIFLCFIEHSFSAVYIVFAYYVGFKNSSGRNVWAFAVIYFPSSQNLLYNLQFHTIRMSQFHMYHLSCSTNYCTSNYYPLTNHR